MSFRILIVDDSAFMRMQLTNILVEYGYDVVGYGANGLEALSKFIELKPDVVFMDITMPQLNGLEALKKIKELDNSTYVVMCSAMGQQSIIKNAMNLGATDFIIKPFQADQINLILENIENKKNHTSSQ